MSKIRTQSPIIHTPTFKEYQIEGNLLKFKLQAMDMRVSLGMLDSIYYYTDLEGWGKILYNLVFNSNLYKTNKFDCENFAMKAMNLCAERYGLNTMGLVVGDIPLGRHGFNIIYCGQDLFKLWEPNSGFDCNGEAFDLGENGYFPDLVFI